MRAPMLLALIFTLAACDAKDTDPGPGGVSVGEAKALDQAAEMLDARELPALPEATAPAEPAPTPAP